METPEYFQQIQKDRLFLYKAKMIRTCKECKGTGHYFVECINLRGEKEEQYKDCPVCMTKFHSVKKYIEANILSEYLDITIDNASFAKETKKQMQAMMDVLQKTYGEYSFVFYRSELNPSYGVTTAGILFVKKMIDLNYDSYVIEYSDICDCFFSFGDDKKTNTERSQKINWLSQIPVLMIDNFGKNVLKKSSEDGYVYSKLVNFFNIRKLNSTMTILCSDISNQKILDEYTGGIGDIIKMHYFPIEIIGETNGNKPRASDKLFKDFPELKKEFGITLKPRLQKVEKKEPKAE